MFCLMFKNLLSWIESVSIQSSLACLWPSDCSLANKNKAHGFPGSHWHTKEKVELFTVNQPFKTPCHKQSLTFAPLVFGWVSVFTSGVILSGFQVPVNESTIGDGLCAAAVYLLSGWQMIGIRCSSRQECSQVSAKTPPTRTVKPPSRRKMTSISDFHRWNVLFLSGCPHSQFLLRATWRRETLMKILLTSHIDLHNVSGDRDTFGIKHLKGCFFSDSLLK